jgi:hypothetical protein
MKVKHYNEMMAYLTRPGFNSGGSVNFNGGGSVKNKPVLPKRKPPEEVKKRKKINYEKIKQYLGKESQELIERELGFDDGGRVGFADGYGPFEIKQGPEKGKFKLKFTSANPEGKAMYFDTKEEAQNYLDTRGEKLEKAKIKREYDPEREKASKFLYDKKYRDLNKDEKQKVRTRIAATGKFTAKKAKDPLTNRQQALILKEFPDADFTINKYGFPREGGMYDKVINFIERGYKLRSFKPLSKPLQRAIKENFPEYKDWNFKTNLYGVPSGQGADMKLYDRVRRFTDDPKPFQFAFNLRSPGGWTLAQMYRAGEDKYEPIYNKNEKITGFKDKTGKSVRTYNIDNINKHPNFPEIQKYYDVAELSRTPVSKYENVAKLLPEGFDPNKILINDLLQFIADKDGRTGINRAKRAIEIHHTQGVRNQATGSFQLLRSDLNKLADTIEQEISKGNLDRAAELDAQRIRVETGGVKYGGRARTPKGDFRALLKGVETELQSSKFKPKDFAKALREAGFKCKFAGAEGGDVRCDNPVNYVDDMKRNQNMAMKGSPEGKARAFTKFRRAKSFLTGTLGPAALAGEALFSVPFALYDYSTGANRDEIISNLTFGLAGKSQEEQLRELYGEDFGLAQKAIETGERLENLDKLQQGTRGQRIRSKGKFDIAAKQFEEQLSPFIKDGQFDEVAFQNNRKQEQLGLKKFGEQKAEKAEQRKDALTGLEFDLEFAGGGIAKEGGVDSGVAPESGPTPDGPSEGLASLLKNGMKIKE